MATAKKSYKEKMMRKKEEKQEEPEGPKYRDRAKERREDQNPDYEPTELGSFHAVAPPGTADLSTARGSPKRQELFEKAGHFQVPYLEDPNTGVKMFESAEIIDYLRATYSLSP